MSDRLKVITAQDIAEIIGLDPKLLERPCDKGVLRSLAEFVHPWRSTFDFLLTPMDIDDIIEENRTENDRRVAALRRWRIRCGSEATYSALVSVILKNRDVERAEKLCQYVLETTKKEQGKCR